MSNIENEIKILLNLFNSAKFDILISKAKKLIKKAPEYLILYNILGSAYQNIGDLKLAIKLNLDGVYFPSFNRDINFNKSNFKKKFIIIGSAHSVQEIKIKEQQGVKLIFLSPLFKVNKNNKFLNPIKFNLLAAKTNIKVIALGGINQLNFKKLNLVKSYGFAGISYFIKQNNI